MTIDVLYFPIQHENLLKGFVVGKDFDGSIIVSVIDPDLDVRDATIYDVDRVNLMKPNNFLIERGFSAACIILRN